jgi:hypothetical protein
MSGVWPTADQEQILRACFAEEPEAGDALAQVVRKPVGSFDRASMQLLPLLYQRWRSREDALFSDARKAYVMTWRQNQARFAQLAALLQRFEAQKVAYVVLKGVALTLRYYRDPGVRGMRDFDLLVNEQNVEVAAQALRAAGYEAEQGLDIHSIRRRVRVGHAWQFSFASDQTCDLHWRPLVRCYAPVVSEMFWEGAQRAPLGDRFVSVLSPTDQLFHVCAHGLQWDWTPQIRWVADALTVLREAVDWVRIEELAREAFMHIRLSRALSYLKDRFHARVPAAVLQKLEESAPDWERVEYDLLLKQCPLGFRDSFAWHLHHFRRIRPFDDQWKRMPMALGFAQYVPAFLNAGDLPEALRKLWPEMKARAAAGREEQSREA